MTMPELQRIQEFLLLCQARAVERRHRNHRNECSFSGRAKCP